MEKTPSYIKCEVQGETLTLLPEKAIFWESRKSLLIADLHLGKVSHFRKAGIAVPQASKKSNSDRLFLLLDSLDLENVYLLGDLFHSDFNDEWSLIEDITNQYPEIDFHLIIGNHDILKIDRYKESRLILHRENLQLGPFSLTHEPAETENAYNLCGHIHPGIALRGRGKQRLRLPCFFFGEKVGILPAFGAFTGLYTLSKKEVDRVFVIAKHQVLEV